MSLHQMAIDLVEAADRYRANNPAPQDDTPRIEDHIVFIHVGGAKP